MAGPVFRNDMEGALRLMDVSPDNLDAWLAAQAVAEAKSLAPTQEELDDAESTYADTYGENRAHLNALQSCVLDWLEENSTVA